MFPYSKSLPKQMFLLQSQKQMSQLSCKYLNQFLNQSLWLGKRDGRPRLHATGNITSIQRTWTRVVPLQRKIRAVLSERGSLYSSQKKYTCSLFSVKNLPSPPLSIESNHSFQFYLKCHFSITYILIQVLLSWVNQLPASIQST